MNGWLRRRAGHFGRAAGARTDDPAKRESSDRALDELTTAPMSRLRRIGLVGCVKEKARTERAAKDLYTSTLFSGRRRYVERCCDEWWILSAEHGLVHPDDVLAPYDTTLKDAGRTERRLWTDQVLAAIDERIRPRDATFEVHAGLEYRDYGLVAGLQAWGCDVVVPTEGMRIGQQLQFYARAEPCR